MSKIKVFYTVFIIPTKSIQTAFLFCKFHFHWINIQQTITRDFKNIFKKACTFHLFFVLKKKSSLPILRHVRDAWWEMACCHDEEDRHQLVSGWWEDTRTMIIDRQQGHNPSLFSQIKRWHRNNKKIPTYGQMTTVKNSWSTSWHWKMVFAMESFSKTGLLGHAFAILPVRN